MRRGFRSFQFLFRRARRTAVARLGANLLGDRRGAVAMYAAFVGVVLIGSGVLVIDVGRLMVLRAEMQDAADSAALSAVVHLDGTEGAIARATAMAQSGVRHASGVKEGSGNLVVSTLTFFSVYTPGSPGSGTVTAVDSRAAYIRVELQPETMSILLQPILAIFGGSGVSSKTYTTYAVAENGGGGVSCAPTPFMVCDPGEADPLQSLTLLSNIGKQMIIKEGPGSGLMAPGEFGLLCTPAGDCGASAIEAAIRNPNASECLESTGDVTTAPGSKTNPVVQGVNSRFDCDPPGPAVDNNPASNVLNYYRDTNIAGTGTGELGNGDWTAATYWNDFHGGGLPLGLTGAVGPNPTRYQVYLWESGLTFYVGTIEGNIVVAFPNDPGGWTAVQGPAGGIPGLGPAYPNMPGSANERCRVDNVTSGLPDPGDPFDPSTICLPEYPTSAACQAARRLVGVAVLPCVDLGVQGSNTYNAAGKTAMFFITEYVIKPGGGGGNAAVYAELAGPMIASGEKLFAGFTENVRLVE